MAKNAIYDYSTTPGDNADIGGTDISGATGKVSNGDNAIRSFMEHAKEFALDLGAVNTVAGTGDAITVTLAASPTALVDGMRFTFSASAANTGATTLNVTPNGGSALGAKKVMKWSAGSEAELAAGDITAANALVEVIYDSARNGAAGAFMLTIVADATTTTAGKVELATPAEATAGSSTSLAVTPAGLYYPAGHLYGLTLSNNATDATNDIDIAAGSARDSTNAENMVLASALTKQLDAAWAVGSGFGGLDTGTIADTTYHVWLIKRSDTGVVDVLFSTSATAPTMPTGYDYKRRIGSIVRTGAAIKAFKQNGDEFLWNASVTDVNGSTASATAASVTLTVPTGIKVNALVSVFINSSGTLQSEWLSSLDVSDQATGTGGRTSTAAGSGVASGLANVRTNTSGQIRRVETANGGATITIYTHGYIDTRGRN